MLIVAGFLVSILTGVVLYFLPAIQVALRDTGQANTSLGGNPQLRPVSASESLSSTSPFTLLLLGSDSDSKFKGDYLTQSMILTRVDPATKHVTMLSIPRDLWVRLCNGSNGKIDQAFLHGGAQCAIQTVEKDLDVHVDYYAWIGLQGLVSVLNQVGGVNVIANNPVMDDYYPADLSGGSPFAYQRILVLPGAQHMDGTLALEYVRARHDDAYGDFARSQRQQQILIALRAKTKHLTIADVPGLATSLGSDFQTNMSISQVSGLLPIAGSVPLSSITQVVLLPPYTSTEIVGGQDALRPNWALIRPEVAKYFPAK
jgi:LCP family protein required for cell wall assembly